MDSISCREAINNTLFKGKQYCENMNIVYRTDGSVVLCRASDVGRILKLKNVRSSLTSLPFNEKRTVRLDTRGGLQKSTMLTIDGVKRLICNSRSLNASSMADAFGIEVHSNRYVPKETETLAFLRKVFVGVDMLPQYFCGEYKIDMYIPSCKLAIECDEDGNHGPGRALEDFERERWIKNKLGCTFVRYRPDDPDFDVAEVAGMVFRKMMEMQT